MGIFNDNSQNNNTGGSGQPDYLDKKETLVLDSN